LCVFQHANAEPADRGEAAPWYGRPIRSGRHCLPAGAGLQGHGSFTVSFSGIGHIPQGTMTMQVAVIVD
jgi:hypothetical protein